MPWKMRERGLNAMRGKLELRIQTVQLCSLESRTKRSLESRTKQIIAIWELLRAELLLYAHRVVSFHLMLYHIPIHDYRSVEYQGFLLLKKADCC